MSRTLGFSLQHTELRYNIITNRELLTETFQQSMYKVHSDSNVDKVFIYFVTIHLTTLSVAQIMQRRMTI